MKRKLHVLLIVTIGLLSISSSINSQSYTVEGTTDPSQNGKKAYLYDVNTKRAIDSVNVETGKFTFKGVTNEAKYCRAAVERSSVNFVLEPGTILINLKERTVSGTPFNEVLAKHSKDIVALYKERAKIYTDLKEAGVEQAQLRKDFDSISQAVWTPKFKALMTNSLDSNANNILGSVIVSDMNSSGSFSLEEMDAALAKLGKDILALPMVDALVKTNEALKSTSAGRMFTDFTIDQPDGSKKSLSDYAGKGKYLLVDFWASWCGPCRAEIPNLKELYEKYKGDKFEILGVVVWDKLDETMKALEKEGMTWPQILDAQKVPTDIYGIKGIPQIMLIGPDGTIVARDLRGDAMKAKVAEVLSK